MPYFTRAGSLRTFCNVLDLVHFNGIRNEGDRILGLVVSHMDGLLRLMPSRTNRAGLSTDLQLFQLTEEIGDGLQSRSSSATAF